MTVVLAQQALANALVEDQDQRPAVKKASIDYDLYWQIHHGQEAAKSQGARLLTTLVGHERGLTLVLLKVEMEWKKLLQEHAIADKKGTASKEAQEQWAAYATWLQRGDV